MLVTITEGVRNTEIVLRSKDKNFEKAIKDIGLTFDAEESMGRWYLTVRGNQTYKRLAQLADYVNNVLDEPFSLEVE